MVQTCIAEFMVIHKLEGHIRVVRKEGIQVRSFVTGAVLRAPVVQPEVLRHLVVGVERIRMVLHLGTVNHVMLPRIVQLVVIVRCTGDGRSHVVCAQLDAKVNERSITLRVVILEVSSRRTFPQKEAHGHLSFKHILRTGKALHGEGLEDNFTVGIADIHITL